MLNRFKGCLLGLAVGDALGAPVEFLSIHKIKEKYGGKGIVDYDVWGGFKPGSYSDETQLSLATAKACINAYLNLINEGESLSHQFVYKRYLEWLDNLKDSFRVRQPGYTCMNVLQSGKKGSIADPINDSNEASGLLRTAPVGLAFPPGMAFREGADYAALTHGHPTAYLAAGFFSEMIAQIIQGKSLQDAVELSIETLISFDDHQDLLKHLEKALELFIDQVPIESSVTRFGKGVTAAEVLAIGVLCALKFVFEYQEGVLASVNHSGGSTSTGTVTGAVLGTFLGADAIPQLWVSQLEDSQEIVEIAEDMHSVFKKGVRISFEKYSLD
jgi:ADP-ribosylglycohydrolase